MYVFASLWGAFFGLIATIVFAKLIKLVEWMKDVNESEQIADVIYGLALIAGAVLGGVASFHTVNGEAGFLTNLFRLLLTPLSGPALFCYLSVWMFVVRYFPMLVVMGVLYLSKVLLDAVLRPANYLADLILRVLTSRPDDCEKRK